MLVSRIVIDDQMRLLGPGCLSINGLEKAQPLLMAVKLICQRQHFAREHVGCSKQRGYAETLRSHASPWYLARA